MVLAASVGEFQWAYPPQSYVLGLTLPFLLLAWAATALRFLARRVQRAGLRADDWLALPAFMAVAGSAAVLIAASTEHAITFRQPLDPVLNFGLQPAVSSQRPNLAAGHQLHTVLEWMQTAALGTSKLSLVYLYRRHLPDRDSPHVLVSTAASALIEAWTAAFLLATLFQCGTDFSALFGLSPSASACAASSPIGVALAVTNIILYLVVAALPVPLLWKLPLSRAHKLGVAAIYVLGALAVCAGVMRTMAAATDAQWALGWNMWEAGISVVAINLPAMLPLLPAAAGGAPRPRRKARVQSVETGHGPDWNARPQSAWARGVRRKGPTEAQRAAELQAERQMRLGLRGPNERPLISPPILHPLEQRLMSTSTASRREPSSTEVVLHPLLRQQLHSRGYLPDELILVPRNYGTHDEPLRRPSHGHYSLNSAPSPLTPAQRKNSFDAEPTWRPSPVDGAADPFRSPRTQQSPAVGQSPLVSQSPAPAPAPSPIAPQPAQLPAAPYVAELPAPSSPRPPQCAQPEPVRHQRAASAQEAAPRPYQRAPSAILPYHQRAWSNQEHIATQHARAPAAPLQRNRVSHGQLRAPLKLPPQPLQISAAKKQRPVLRVQTPVARESLDRALPPLPVEPGRASAASSALRGSMASPALRSSLASPALRGSMASPALRSNLASPALHNSVASPALRDSVAGPVVRDVVASLAARDRMVSPAPRSAALPPQARRVSRQPADQSPEMVQQWYAQRSLPVAPAAEAGDRHQAQRQVARGMRAVAYARRSGRRGGADRTWFDSRSSRDSEDVVL